MAADAGITDRSNAVSPDGAVNATRFKLLPQAKALSNAGDVGRGRKPPSRLPNRLVGDDAACTRGDKLCTFLWLPPWFLGGEPATATVNLGVSLLCLFADFLAGDEPAAKGGSRPLDM